MGIELIVDRLTERLKNQELTRIVAFGSSNTQRLYPGMHWFDCLDLALCSTYEGHHHRCLNSGVGGDNTRDLLNRFEQDAAFYKPNLTFITVGGNDSKEEDGVPPEEYERNLLTLNERLTELGSDVIFQTYYAPVPDLIGHDMAERFYVLMDIVRKVSRVTGAGLIDHLARWLPFSVKYPEAYREMMNDGFHVNREGNMVMGLDIARCFGVDLCASDPAFWSRARLCRRLMDDQDVLP